MLQRLHTLLREHVPDHVARCASTPAPFDVKRATIPSSACVVLKPTTRGTVRERTSQGRVMDDMRARNRRIFAERQEQQERLVQERLLVLN